jgi:hypothetical protein
LDVVRLDLGADHGAVALRVLCLYDRHGCGSRPAQAHRIKASATALSFPPRNVPIPIQSQRRECSLNVLYD